MPCSNQFGKKALSYSIIKTSQWKVTVCPFIDKDQHSATCAHTHSHTPKHPYIRYSQTHYKMFHNSLTISLQYRETNTTSFFILVVFGLNQKYIAGRERNRSYISVNHKQPCVQTVANHRLDETKKALIRNTASPSQGYYECFLSVCVCVCACSPSWSPQQKKVFVIINDSDVTVAFAVKRRINYLRLLYFWTESLVCVSYQTFVLWSFSSFMLSLHIFF